MPSPRPSVWMNSSAATPRTQSQGEDRLPQSKTHSPEEKRFDGVAPENWSLPAVSAADSRTVKRAPSNEMVWPPSPTHRRTNSEPHELLNGRSSGKHPRPLFLPPVELTASRGASSTAPSSLTSLLLHSPATESSLLNQTFPAGGRAALLTYPASAPRELRQPGAAAADGAGAQGRASLRRSQSLELTPLSGLPPTPVPFAGLSASESAASLLRSALDVRRGPLEPSQRSVSDLNPRLPQRGAHTVEFPIGSGSALSVSDPSGARGHPPQQQLQNLQTLQAASKPRGRASQGKYDAATVFLLRDFYRRLDDEGSRTFQDPAFQKALEEPEFQPIRSHAALDLLVGQPRLMFRLLLKAMYPEAELRDFAAMVFLAFPPVKSDPFISALRLEPEQQAEVEDMFRQFDADGDGVINSADFKGGIRGLHIPEALGRKLMRMADLDNDGRLTREEFEYAVKRLYA